MLCSDEEAGLPCVLACMHSVDPPNARFGMLCFFKVGIHEYNALLRSKVMLDSDLLACEGFLNDMHSLAKKSARQAFERAVRPVRRRKASSDPSCTFHAEHKDPWLKSSCSAAAIRRSFGGPGLGTWPQGSARICKFPFMQDMKFLVSMFYVDCWPESCQITYDSRSTRKSARRRAWYAWLSTCLLELKMQLQNALCR